MVSKIVLTCAFLIAPSIVAIAQTSIEFDFGVRGGAFNSGIPLEVFSNHYFPPAYSTDKMPYTFGPTVGVLINDRFGIRFEAVRSLFRFRAESTTPFPISGQKSVATTDGHMWQYPLLMTIHSSSGAVRAFGGGGISFGRTISGTTSAVVTSITPPTASGVITTTFSTTPFRPNSSPLALYITGGLDGRVSFLSIRPELRYGHWNSSLADQENQMLFSSNQFEFLVGVTAHPFRFKGR